MKQKALGRAAFGLALVLSAGLAPAVYADADPAAVAATQAAIDNANQRYAAIQAELPAALAGASRKDQNKAQGMSADAARHLSTAEQVVAEKPVKAQRQVDYVLRMLEKIQQNFGIELGGEG